MPYRRKNPELLKIYHSTEFKELQKYISHRIRAMENPRIESQDSLANRTYQAMGVGMCATLTEFHHLRKNDFMSGAYNDKMYFKRLRRSAIALYALGVEEEDELIGKIKEFFPEFLYPPPDNVIAMISTDKVEQIQKPSSGLEERIALLNPADKNLVMLLINRLVKK